MSDQETTQEQQKDRTMTLHNSPQKGPIELLKLAIRRLRN
jgi:hypothetical protein